MKDSQHYAHKWLSRMWNTDDEVKQYRDRAEKLLGAKIPAYDSEKIPGGSDPNPTESKNIEYSALMMEIEKRENQIAYENNRTFNVIQKIDDAKLRGILYARYVNRLFWKQIGREFHYERTQMDKYRLAALDAAYPLIPKGEVQDGEEL